MYKFGQGVRVTFGGTPLTTLRDILSPAHPPCFIDISAMLQSNMADMSLSRGRGRKARKGVRGQVLDSSRSLGMTGSRGLGWGRGVPARRGVRFQEGWVPASAGMTGEWGVGGVGRATTRVALTGYKKDRREGSPSPSPIEGEGIRHPLPSPSGLCKGPIGGRRDCGWRAGMMGGWGGGCRMAADVWQISLFDDLRRGNL